LSRESAPLHAYRRSIVGGSFSELPTSLLEGDSSPLDENFFRPANNQESTESLPWPVRKVGQGRPM
jgi:hypothetical protein